MMKDFLKPVLLLIQKVEGVQGYNTISKLRRRILIDNCKKKITKSINSAKVITVDNIMNLASAHISLQGLRLLDNPFIIDLENYKIKILPFVNQSESLQLLIELNTKKNSNIINYGLSSMIIKSKKDSFDLILEIVDDSNKHNAIRSTTNDMDAIYRYNDGYTQFKNYHLNQSFMLIKEIYKLYFFAVFDAIERRSNGEKNEV